MFSISESQERREAEGQEDWTPSSHGLLSGHRAMISLGDILERFSARRPCPQPFCKVKTVFTLCPETLTLDCVLNR